MSRLHSCHHDVFMAEACKKAWPGRHAIPWQLSSEARLRDENRHKLGL